MTVETNHFWISSFPFCETTLFLCPTPGAPVHALAKLELFDCDGALINEVQLASPNGAPVALELDPLMERCKMDSGMRHAHLVVHTPPDMRPTCRLHNRAGAVITGRSITVNPELAMFSPVTITPHQTSLLTLVNHGGEEASVRCRLMCGSRNPDLTCVVPPFGARIVCLEEEFRDALIAGFGGAARQASPDKSTPELRAYLRVSVRSEQNVGVQLVESKQRKDEGDMFLAISR